MATYEDIKKANETLMGMDIKGKTYIEVNQRIKAFRMVYPEGSIITELVELENGVCTIRAVVKSGDNILGTGFAQEKESSSFINKTSYIENCETSAVGRALGMCGFGIDTSVCSAEELMNAINNQDKKPEKKKAEVEVEYATEEQRSKITKLYDKAPDKLNKALGRYGVTNVVMLTKIQAQAIIDRVEAAQKTKGDVNG